jgi:hypothetical protein
VTVTVSPHLPGGLALTPTSVIGVPPRLLESQRCRLPADHTHRDDLSRFRGVLRPQGCPHDLMM